MKQNNYIICSHISILPNHPLFGISHVHNTISTSFPEYSFEIFTTIVLLLICWFRIWSIYSDYASLGLLHRPSPRRPVQHCCSYLSLSQSPHTSLIHAHLLSYMSTPPTHPQFQRIVFLDLRVDQVFPRGLSYRD